MSSFDYDNAGLGLAFPPTHFSPQQDQQPQHQMQQTQRHPQLHQLPSTDLQQQHLYSDTPRPVRPPLSIRAHGFPHINGHQRTQSAVLPQRPFDGSPYRSPEQMYYAPRSAQPLQHPFPSPDGKHPQEYVHSAPVTPETNRPQRSLSYQLPQTEFPRNGRSFRQPVDSHPPPNYMGSPRYYEGQTDTRFSHRPDSSASGSSYYYNTPQVENTPFTESGQFPLPDTHPYGGNSGGGGSNYNTPNLLSSPVFDSPYGRQTGGYFDDDDDMPDEPYVPSTKTNFPPMRPSGLRNNQSDEGLHTMMHTLPPQRNTIAAAAAATAHHSSSSPEMGVKEKKPVYSKWTPSEDSLLKEAIARHGDGKWSLIASCVPGRTPMQCSTRWQGALNTTIHKGRWDPEEDAILIKAVAEWQGWHVAESNREAATSGVRPDPATLEEDLYKNIPWSNIATFLPRPRTGVQALARWSEALDPRITKGKWTAEEDVSLMRGVHTYGKCWIKIANGVRGRTQRQCRTRYCQIVDKKRKLSAKSPPAAGPGGGAGAGGASSSSASLMASLIPGSHAMDVPDMNFSD